ncbi:MAG: sporulation protein YqfD [Clostridia bacterium]|nr:sporulation protein YqfD [Clostridia bacterium]
MLKERLQLTGVCPERALARFNRQGIAVFQAVKENATTLCFSVRRQDVKKVLSIYPDARYQQNGYAYSVRPLPPRGWLKILRGLRNRIGILVGGLAFVLTLTIGERFLLKIEVDAPAVYQAQVAETLQRNGIKQYLPYQKGKEDLICASLLALDGVSYCSVKKSGSVLYVVLKTNSFSNPQTDVELLAERSGTLLRLVVLRGTAVKEEGTEVKRGERLVEGALYSESGERMPTKAVAYAQLACTYRQRHLVESEQEAFAAAYLQLDLQDGGEVTSCQIQKTENGYDVTIGYVWTQSLGI